MWEFDQKIINQAYFLDDSGCILVCWYCGFDFIELIVDRHDCRNILSVALLFGPRKLEKLKSHGRKANGEQRQNQIVQPFVQNEFSARFELSEYKECAANSRQPGWSARHRRGFCYGSGARQNDAPYGVPEPERGWRMRSCSRLASDCQRYRDFRAIIDRRASLVATARSVQIAYRLCNGGPFEDAGRVMPVGFHG
ncbi:hypothetical protein [Bosea sp. (in: a-proteobacteria)]|uniref:hypothetical protein n=1 Tax=Bosea sp. (in: a-proteobacteria) TaxID=1871050 RepID=UPI00261A9DD0|nr:hypothetical protein [Bosea sp. (in: a-proteobacteria)]MCO5092218.1 hypothetical protein [Bosea sp. (in: a-proteobacteria)]